MRAPSQAFLGAALAALLCAGSARAAPLTADEENGKRIFFSGVATSGSPLLAVVDANATAISGAETACASCHGEGGAGRDTSDPPAPDVTWSSLSRPHSHPDGREHPAFDPVTLAFAIANGIDPAGNPLDPAMPRYQATQRDVHCIVAYLQRIETDRDPGVERDALVLGTVVPADAAQDGPGSVIRKMLEAWVADVNAAGGIHGRTLRLAVGAYDAAQPGAALAAATRLVTEERVFALVSGFTPGAEEAIAELVQREGVPLVGPFTFLARESTPTNRWLFHLLAGPAEQARALAEHASRRIDGPRPGAAILHADDPHLAAAAQAAAKELAARGWTRVEVAGHGKGAADAAVAARLRDSEVAVVVFLGGDAELAALLRAADEAGWTPLVLAPGALTARAAVGAPTSFRGRIFLSYPFAPTDEAPPALAALGRTRARAGVGERHRPAQVAAYTAAVLLGECLKRLGRGVSRERLVGVIEGLWAFEPGLVPPLTYGASRRVGAHGAHVVAVDVEARSIRPAEGWISVP